jgi:hypothetical protein
MPGDGGALVIGFTKKKMKVRDDIWVAGWR